MSSPLAVAAFVNDGSGGTMTIHRRDIMKAGAAGIVVALNAGLTGCRKTEESADAGGSSTPASGGVLRMKIRGLVLLDYQPSAKTLYLRMLDAEKQSMPKHEARLIMPKGVIDEDATSSKPSRIDDKGTSKEKWVWLLKGITVSVLPDTEAADTELESSNPSGEKPVLGNWKSLKWIPNLKQVAGASTVNADPGLFVCNIPLTHGLVQAEKPKGRVGNETKWTVTKSSDSSLVTRQYYSDTVIFTRKLQGRTPVIVIAGTDEGGTDISGKIVVRQGAAGEIVYENFDPKVIAKPGDPTSLGHFTAFFGVVDTQFPTVWTPDPTTLPDCSTCETDPIFCPPASI